MIHIPIASFALLGTAGIFIALLVHGFETGEASTKDGLIARADNPAGFWAMQALNGILVITCLFGALLGITGL